MFNLNPIDVLKKREMKFIPPHFSKMKIENAEFMFDNSIKTWIQTKLRGRYCIKRAPSIDQEDHLKSATFVAFEEQKELTYFMLACPHLRRN